MRLLNNYSRTYETEPEKLVYLQFKQLGDRFFCCLFLLLLSPLLFIVSVLIRLDSPGPIFFIQERIGKDGQPFKLIKFRTMYLDAEKHGPQWAKKNDNRITNIGYYLRKYRLDEIPQFFNVIKGDMALIGPRPERKVFIEKFEKNIPAFRERLKVKPGITGLAQVSGGYDLNPAEKLHLDLLYIENLSFLLDIKITMKSIPVIVFAKGWR